MASVNVRKVYRKDIPFLAAVYRDAVINLGSRGYRDEQLKVWAAFADDSDAFEKTVLAGKAICIDVSGVPVAFGELHPVDHIALLYCHSRYAGHGYASAILKRLEGMACEEGVTNLGVKASIVARPFFEHFGYRVIEEESVIRSGVTLQRYHMEKTLAASYTAE